MTDYKIRGILNESVNGKDNIGEQFNGRAAVSKTVDGGSSPSSPVIEIQIDSWISFRKGVQLFFVLKAEERLIYERETGFKKENEGKAKKPEP